MGGRPLFTRRACNWKLARNLKRSISTTRKATIDSRTFGSCVSNDRGWIIERHEILTRLDLSDGTYPSYGYLFSCLTLAGLTSLDLSPAAKHIRLQLYFVLLKVLRHYCVYCVVQMRIRIYIYIFKYCFNNNLSRTGETNWKIYTLWPECFYNRRLKKVLNTRNQCKVCCTSATTVSRVQRIQ